MFQLCKSCTSWARKMVRPTCSVINLWTVESGLFTLKCFLTFVKGRGTQGGSSGFHNLDRFVSSSREPLPFVVNALVTPSSQLILIYACSTQTLSPPALHNLELYNRLTAAAAKWGWTVHLVVLYLWQYAPGTNAQ